MRDKPSLEVCLVDTDGSLFNGVSDALESRPLSSFEGCSGSTMMLFARVIRAVVVVMV